MKKLHPLLSILFLIYWGCGEKLREPIGEAFELLNIKNILYFFFDNNYCKIVD